MRTCFGLDDTAQVSAKPPSESLPQPQGYLFHPIFRQRLHGFRLFHVNSFEHFPYCSIGERSTNRPVARIVDHIISNVIES